jgi:hypothetical protein
VLFWADTLEASNSVARSMNRAMKKRLLFEEGIFVDYESFAIDMRIWRGRW